MFIKNKDSQEGLIHICKGKTEKQMRQKNEILKHDVTSYMIVWDERGKPTLQHIKFCPYCGDNLEKED